ncbi:MAG: beta-propeller domain-containing protein [Oscillospiraceae bacterium]|nr:beta-propeller domain-containing protein [Oscillospiraceae bacterium]
MKKILLIVLVLAAFIPGLILLQGAVVSANQGEQAPGAPLPSTLGGGDVRLAAAGAGGQLELYLHIGSPIALSDGKIHPIDSDNPGLTPVLHKDKTLVPLKFVSEFFGAEVSYDSRTRTGIVKTDGKTAEFPVGGDWFVLDGERIASDAETLIIDGRIMLPLRVLCEKVLGLSVDYRSSIIFIAETASLNEATVNEVKSKIGMYVKVADTEELKRYLKEASGGGYPIYGVKAEEDRGNMTAAEPAPSAPAAPQESGSIANDMLSADAAGGASGGAAGGHSSTNTQVEGVDEGDIIKTDGKYIYLSCFDNVKIISVADKMSLAAQIDTPGDYLTDMYTDDGRLILIGGESAPKSRDPVSGRRTDFVVVNVYDTSDITNIKLVRSYKTEGQLMTARKQAGYLYLLSTQYIYIDGIETDPRPLAGEGERLVPISTADIMIAPGCPADSFLTLTAVNIGNPDEPAASETITVSGYSTAQYMSNNAMYIAARDYMYGGGLNIAKFSVDGGKIGYSGSGGVRGDLNNQFSMDEYRGHLRIATTEWSGGNKNNLFVLDGNMQVCGSVEGFAPGERIYSVRFMGERGYIVTFRETDPLFVFDLSNPVDPKITGELKVPGFSTYLHPVSENVILGVGNDVYDIYMKDSTGKEIVVGQRTGGLKLSLFDVSDMGKPREIDTLVLGDGGHSELLYNHKAAMFKTDESILAFCADIATGAADKDWFSGAFILSYAGNKLSERGRIGAAQSDGISYGYGFSGQRLVYSGNTLYFAQHNMLRSFDLTTLVEKQSVRLG